jgi:membrane fusion protein (multidrug efflux system)
MKQGTTKRMIIMLVIAGLIVGGVVGFQTFKNMMIAKAMKAGGLPPQTISTVVAQESVWQPTVEAMGSFTASQQASLGSEVGGLVTSIHFESGQKVQAGTPLVELNPAPLQAQLAQIEAQAQLAEINLKRDEAQLKIQAISQAVVDTDAATLKGLQAQAAAQKALIAQKTIAAPFGGQLGIRQVDLGQYLAPGSTVVSLQELDPMDIDFTVPQSQIELIRVGMKAQVETSAVPGRNFTATVTAIEPQIDTATRNLKVRARVPNPKGELLPGVFGTVHITEGKPHSYITLPNAAVAFNPYGATVFVVEEEGKDKDGKPKLVAKQRFVTTGLTRGDQVAIVQGLKPGETVVTAGQLKLRNGSPVLINNSVQPADEANPQVPNS